MKSSLPVITLIAALLMSVGCNKVAVLDGELTLPALPTQYSELWVSPQVMRSTTRFEDTWAGSSLEPVQLQSGTPQYLFSLETEDPDGDLHIKIRFCRNRACDFLPSTPEARADPQAEIWYLLEHPFYLMKKDPEPTGWTTIIADVPQCELCLDGSICSSGTCSGLGVCESSPGQCVQVPAPADCVLIGTDRPTWQCNVDKCDISGCIGGTPTTYCDILDDGTRVHICET